ncbi:hypothetical protein COOONC_04941 [Cooperia oncophora]
MVISHSYTQSVMTKSRGEHMIDLLSCDKLDIIGNICTAAPVGNINNHYHSSVDWVGTFQSCSDVKIISPGHLASSFDTKMQPPKRASITNCDDDWRSYRVCRDKLQNKLVKA